MLRQDEGCSIVSYWVRYLSLGLGSGWASIGLIDGYLGLGLDFG